MTTNSSAADLEARVARKAVRKAIRKAERKTGNPSTSDQKAKRKAKKQEEAPKNVKKAKPSVLFVFVFGHYQRTNASTSYVLSSLKRYKQFQDLCV